MKMLAKMHPDKLKMHQKAFGGRALPGPTGELTALPQIPLTGFKGAYF